MIKILSPGMLSTVQDGGRFGLMKNGFTQSGAMDRKAMKTANALCGNDLCAPVIEMTMTGIKCEFTEDAYFCLSGANMSPVLNGVPITNNRAFLAKKGSVLSLGAAVTGLRCCLAFSGGVDVPIVMGSASLNQKLSIGGFEGRKLKKGDELKLGKEFRHPDVYKTIDEDKYPSDITVRVVMGPQDDMFTDTDINLFLKQTYTVTPFYDRMGIRLSGIALKGKNGMDIISDGITFGSVQISRNGQPIILMADHQTTGGYAKIATVISCDLPKLAQAKSNDTVRFEKVSVKKAESEAIKEKKYFEKLIKG